MNIVLDTNILVSALWTKSGTTAQLLSSVLNSTYIMCHNAEIIVEYQEVLRRPKFCFTAQEVFELISFMVKYLRIKSLYKKQINDSTSTITPIHT